MQRAARLIELYDRFADNYTRFSELNDALLVDCEAEEWQELLTRRSEAQRSILNENEEILKEARELMSTPIESKEEADEILVYFRRLLNTRLSDFCLLDIVYKPLLDFYEKTNDALRLIGLYVSTGAIMLENFCRIETDKAPVSGLECCERAIAYSKMVSPTKQPDVWMSVFSAYANMMGSVNAYYPENRKRFFQYYDEALAYFDDPKIGPVLMEQPNGPMFKSLVFGRILYAMNCYEVMDEDEKERFRGIIREQIRSLPDDYSPGETSVLKYFLAYQIGDIEPHEAFRLLLDDYFRLGNADYEIKDVLIKTEDYLARSYILSALFGLLEDEAFSEEERNTNVQRVIAIVMELTHSVPYGYMTAYVNYSCTSLCTTMLPMIKDENEIKRAVTSLLILRQPITYIHSLMVKEISVMIAKEMLSRRPMLFAPIFGDTAEEISGRADEIIEFVSNAALLHDIGKSEVANIINNQYRRITDLEFGYIKHHTLCGPEVMRHIDVFKPYFDIMLGHHKTYDGRGGYPAEFDNTASPYRIVIDLITIADCTDAATDILGRNYARGKHFCDLLAELSADKGTRYNPDIVTLIEESRTLCEKLERLTGDDRRKIYYQAYRDVMNLNHGGEDAWGDLTLKRKERTDETR